jgi:DNA-binding FadR family transcriptional regulator
MVEAGDAEGAKQAMEHHLTSVEPAAVGSFQLLANSSQQNLQNSSHNNGIPKAER